MIEILLIGAIGALSDFNISFHFNGFSSWVNVLKQMYDFQRNEN